MRDIIQRFLEGDLTAQKVEDWANLIEAADVALGGIGEEKTIDTIHDLANPALEGPLTQESTQALIQKLEEG